MQLLCGHVRMNIASVNNEEEEAEGEGRKHLIVVILNITN